MTNRTTGRTVTTIAIVVVVLAAVGIGFFLVGRSTGNPPQTTPTIAPPTQTGARPSPTYAPTDQNGSPEPGLQPGPAVAGQGGSKTGPEGLPLGYTHDQTGAVNAATNYLMWMNSLRIADKAAADAMAQSAAADAATRTALIESFDQLRSGHEGLGRRPARTGPRRVRSRQLQRQPSPDLHLGARGHHRRQRADRPPVGDRRGSSWCGRATTGNSTRPSSPRSAPPPSTQPTRPATRPRRRSTPS